jgi:hypothetical protein
MELQVATSADSGHLPEIFICIHQRAKPGVLQLPRTPSLANVQALSGKSSIQSGNDGMDIEYRSVRVEHEAFDRLHSVSPPIQAKQGNQLASRVNLYS